MHFFQFVDYNVIWAEGMSSKQNPKTEDVSVISEYRETVSISFANQMAVSVIISKTNDKRKKKTQFTMKIVVEWIIIYFMSFFFL